MHLLHVELMESVLLQITWYSLDRVGPIPFVLCFSVTQSCLTPTHVWPKHMSRSSSGWVLAMSKTSGVRRAGQCSAEDTQSWCPGSSAGISFQQRPGTNPKVGSGKYKRLGFEPKNSKNRILGGNHFVVHMFYYGMSGSSAVSPLLYWKWLVSFWQLWGGMWRHTRLEVSPDEGELMAGQPSCPNTNTHHRSSGLSGVLLCV